MSASGEVFFRHAAPGFNDRDHILRYRDRVAALPSFEPAFVELSFEGSVQRNQFVPGIRLPCQPERLAGSGCAEQRDAHQAKIVDIFDKFT